MSCESCPRFPQHFFFTFSFGLGSYDILFCKHNSPTKRQEKVYWGNLRTQHAIHRPPGPREDSMAARCPRVRCHIRPWEPFTWHAMSLYSWNRMPGPQSPSWWAPLDGRVVRPWGRSSRHLVGAPPWGTRVPEGDCWHGGQGFSVILSHRHPQPSSPTIGGFPWNDLKVMTVKMTEGNPDMKAMPLNPICWKRGHVFPPWQLIISPII